MLKELKFEPAAIAKKNLLPAMTHFSIDTDSDGGYVRAYNGSLALGSPLAFNIPCKPKASDLVAVIAKCKEPPTLSMTPTGKLSIRSGKGRWLVDCVQEETPHVNPEGERVDFDGAAILEAIKAVEPFIGNDASRQWSNRVLLRGSSAYATNNVTLVECWLGAVMPVTVNLPKAAVHEMLRINEPPLYAQMTESSMTFHFSERRWLRTQLLQTEWPDLSRILDGHDYSLAKPLPDQFFDAIEMVKPLADKMGRIFFRDGKLSTVPKEAEAEKHAVYELADFTFAGTYQISMLELLQDVAQAIDFSSYPRPCIFYGNKLRGAIIGMRL